MAGELPEDALEDLMIAEAMGNEEQNRNMPGAMPGQLLMFADLVDEEDQADGEVEAPPAGNAPVQTANPQEVPENIEQSSEEEDDSEEEDVAVNCFFLRRPSFTLLIYNASPCPCA